MKYEMTRRLITTSRVDERRLYTHKTEQRVAHPCLSYKKAMASWFILEGKVYPVKTCTEEIFKQFISSCNSQWTEEHWKKVYLNTNEEDRKVVRWYVLQANSNKKKQISLYPSEEDATYALNAR